MWRFKLLLALCVAVAASPDEDDREKRWLNWAEILGGEPPKPIKPTTSIERSINNHALIQNYENAISDPNIKAYDYEYDNANNFTDYSYSYDDYDESFFNNDYYEYVDTEDKNYSPPAENVTEDAGDVSQKAERRTLDFFYHLFSDQFRTDQSSDGRPQRDTPTTRRPSLIEAVFRTIDNHIVEDLQEWATYSAQRDAQAANTEAPLPSPAKPAIGVPTSIQQISPDNNIVLVTDEQGNQHVVTIDDIVSSLGELDEQTLTNLLLGPTPSASSRSSEIAINAPSNIGTAKSPVFQEQVPVVLGTHTGGQLGIQRPVRHTGPATTPSPEGDDEVYVVRDEKGEIQVVTINDIISSLAALNDDSLNKLLLEDTAIPALVAPTEPPKVQTTAPPPITTTTALPIPSAVLPNSGSANVSESSTKKSVPKVTYDHNGNIKVLAHPGSVTLDLKDLTWQTEEEQQLKETLPEQTPGPLVIDGSTIKTDNKGNIHITPDPSKPFTLDIQNIIALAEQAETTGNPSKPSRNNISKPQEKQEEKKEEKNDQPKGYELLSYLAGVENFLPAAAIPNPISVQSPRIVEDPAGVNSFRASLLQAIAQQNQVTQPTVPPPTEQPPFLQRLVQPVVQPIVQPFVQAVAQPGQESSSSGGIGATLSRLLSNFVGQSPTPQSVPVQQPKEKTPEEEFIKLVVRQQAPHSDDTHFGEINIPLPQPIHYQPTKKPAQPAVTTTTEATNDTPSLLRNLPAAIQRTILQQVTNIPRFIPAGAQSRVATQRSLTTNVKRSDSGPIIRSDSYIDNARNIKFPVRSDVESQRRADYKLPVAQPTKTVPLPLEKKTALSVTDILSGLPKTVLDSIRKQVRNARIFSSENTEIKSPPESNLKSSEEPDDKGQLERSYSHGPPAIQSYGTIPAYVSPAGYGYGQGYGHSDATNPLFDVYFLADLTKVHKIGDTNLSIKSPIIGDPSYFVRTRPAYGYHR